MTSEKKNYNSSLVALLGLITAAFLLVVGYSLGTVGGSEPLGSVGRTVAVATLALTFGYNLGLATKQRHSGGPEFAFYSWFFGTFVVLTGAVSLVQIVSLGLSPSTLSTISSAQPFRDMMVLILGTLFGSIAIASGFVDTARIRYLKRSFTVFSEYVSQGILFGYATVKITGDLYIGLTLSGAVIIALALGSNWVRTRYAKWKARPRSSPKQPQWKGFGHLGG
jgi:hypothetical protein